MTILDFIIILIYLVLVAVSKIGVTPLSLIGLVLALIIERILLGERVPR